MLGLLKPSIFSISRIADLYRLVLVCYLSEAFDIRSLVIVGLVLIWAFRLGPFLFSAFKRRERTVVFAASRCRFQHSSCLDASGCLGVRYRQCGSWSHNLQQQSPAYFGLYLGAMWIAGFVIEVIADRQKTAFRADPANAEAFTSGLWAWSRHPNYFGEILLWAGIAVIAVPTLQGNQIFLLLSLIWVVVLLTAISGVRMLEGRGKNLGRPEYIDYMKRTPMLMLWPPRKRR